MGDTDAAALSTKRAAVRQIHVDRLWMVRRVSFYRNDCVMCILSLDVALCWCTLGSSLEEDSAHLGKGKGGAHSDILTPSSLLAEVERHFPHLTISNPGIATGMGRSASVAHAHEDDCSTLHPHVHFTPDYSDMTKYGGPYADGRRGGRS